MVIVSTLVTMNYAFVKYSSDSMQKIRTASQTRNILLHAYSTKVPNGKKDDPSFLPRRKVKLTE